MTSENTGSSITNAEKADGSKWIALELAVKHSLKVLLSNPEFRTGVMALGREQALLSDAERLVAILLLLQLEKCGKDGKQLAGAVFKQVVAKAPSSLATLRNEKDQLLVVQRLAVRSIEWVTDYLAAEAWRVGVGKKVAVVTVAAVLRRASTWAKAVEVLAQKMLSVGLDEIAQANSVRVEILLQGLSSGVEGISTSPGEGFFLELSHLLGAWKELAKELGKSSQSVSLFTQCIHLIRVAAATRPLLLQQRELNDLLRTVRQLLSTTRWSASAEVELKKLRNLIGDRLAIDAENGIANLELFGAFESLFEKRSEAVKVTERLAAASPTMAGYLLAWMKSGVLELPHDEASMENDDRQVAALYVRAYAVRELLSAGSGVDSIPAVQAMCIEIEQMAQMRGMELTSKRGDEVEYSPLSQRYSEEPLDGGSKVRIEVPGVTKRIDTQPTAKIILPAWVRRV